MQLEQDSRNEPKILSCSGSAYSSVNNCMYCFAKKLLKTKTQCKGFSFDFILCLHFKKTLYVMLKIPLEEDVAMKNL